MRYIIVYILLLFFLASCCTNAKMRKDGTYISNDTITVLLDFDGDNVPDDIDECPEIPGYPEFNGCPPIKIEYSEDIEIEEMGEPEEEIVMSEWQSNSMDDEIEEVEEITTFSLHPTAAGEMSPNRNYTPLNYITEGDITYVIQDTMIVGEINVVNMTISHNVEILQIIAEVETFSDENIETESIRIAPVMNARLKGSKFDIDAITPESQFLENNSYTIWKWDVIPLEKGNNKLSLSVDIVVDGNGKTIQVYEDFIYVYSDETFFDKIGSFFTENWEWFLSTLIIPLFIFLYNIRKKKKD